MYIPNLMLTFAPKIHKQQQIINFKLGFIMSKEQEMELVRKVGILGLSDLNKLAPIGDLGYANGWYPPFFWKVTWASTELPRLIYNAFNEQFKKNNWHIESHDSGYRCTDHHHYCPELGLRWSVDSGD